MSLLPPRIAGIVVVIACLWYLPWLTTHLNHEALWLSVPFLAATMLMAINILITVINNWHRSIPAQHPLAYGSEPTVAVIIPTCGEPASMVERTALSVIEQDWPHRRLIVVVSDDARQPAMGEMVSDLAHKFPECQIRYHEPPRRNEPGRRGDAKAGNLNSALGLIRSLFPRVAFIETRDADDEVGDASFMRQAIGQLVARPTLAYVQSIKEARVGNGDPFANMDPLFYRAAMYARNAANAVFPCGSGLIWRHSALRSIGDFPTWGLVEDLQSGVEALRRGWTGCYLPVVGAMGQTAPEDIPNVYKQRGTWALDTMRLLLWGNLRGLTLRQRLHFAELGFFYMQGFVVFIFLGALVLSLMTGIQPVERDPYAFVIRFWPFVISVEIFLACLNQGNSFESLWRLRQIWVGLAPIFVRATLMALVKDYRTKPAYKVTRKNHQFSWYWRETGVQIVLLLTLIVALVTALGRGLTGNSFDPTLMYWTAFYAVLLGVFIPRGWHGVVVGNVWLRGQRARLAATAIRSVAVTKRTAGRFERQVGARLRWVALGGALSLAVALAVAPQGRLFVVSLADSLSPKAVANAQGDFLNSRNDEVPELPLSARGPATPQVEPVTGVSGG